MVALPGPLWSPSSCWPEPARNEEGTHKGCPYGLQFGQGVPLHPWFSRTTGKMGKVLASNRLHPPAGIPILAPISKGAQTMILTTTNNIEGKTIRDYCGVVTGEAIVGANIFRDFFAGIRDIVGGRSHAYEKELQRAPRDRPRRDGGRGPSERRRRRGRHRSRLRGRGEGRQHAHGHRQRHGGKGSLTGFLPAPGRRQGSPPETVSLSGSRQEQVPREVHQKLWALRSHVTDVAQRHKHLS